MEKELPNGWVLSQLKDVGDVVTGNTPPQKDIEHFGGNIPWIKPGDLPDSKIIKFEETLSESGALIARLLPPNSVMVSCIGNLGKIGIIDRPATTNQQINSVVFNSSIVNPFFGFYYALTLKEWLYENSSATVSIINKGRFEKAPIPLPPLPEQQRIVAKLDTLFGHLDVLKSRLDRIPQLLKDFRQKVLTQALTGKLTEDWRELNKIPEYSNEVKLIEMLIEKPRNGYSPQGVDYVTDVKSLTLGATTSGKFNASKIKYLDIEPPPKDFYLWLKKGDILIQRSNSFDYVGVSAIYDGIDDDYIYPDLMMKLRVKDQSLIKYIFYQLSSKVLEGLF